MHKFSPTSQHHTNLKPPHSLYLSIFPFFYVCVLVYLCFFLCSFLSIWVCMHTSSKLFSKLHSSDFFFSVSISFFVIEKHESQKPNSLEKPQPTFMQTNTQNQNFGNFFASKLKKKCVIKFVIGVPNRGHTFSGNSKTALS